MTTKEQSNPYSTAGGGVNFETEIQAAFAVSMITSTPAPALPNYPIEQIKLQGMIAGYETDDFIAFAKQSGSGKKAKLFAQIKHSLAITAKDTTFGEVIVAAWADFNNAKLFDRGTDSFALVTGPLSATDITNVRPILEWARHSEDADEFFSKVNAPKFSSKAKQAKLEAFRSQLKAANNGTDLTDDEVWLFMKSFHLLPYDLDVDAGITMPLLMTALDRISKGKSEDLWAKLLGSVRSANQNAGTISPEDLAKELEIDLSEGLSHQWRVDNEKLKEHGSYILNGTKTDIGGITISRKETIFHLDSLMETSDFIFVHGKRGCGKSSVVRQFVDGLGSNVPVYCLRAEDLDHSHLDTVLTSIGIHSTLKELEAGFALIPKRFLILESLEKLLELEHTAAFQDLLQLVQNQSGWKIIASGRDYAYPQIISNFLAPNGLSYESLPIEDFSKSEFVYLCDQLEPMKQFKGNDKLRPLLQNPFMASLAFRVSSAGRTLAPDDGEQTFRSAVWREVIAKEADRKNGLPLKRKAAFIDVSVERAKKMVYAVPVASMDSDTLMALESDHLIRLNVEQGTACPAHDVLEDWAIEEFIDRVYLNNVGSASDFLSAVGNEPAMNRAFRMWLGTKLKFDDSIWGFISEVLSADDDLRFWKDESICALLNGEDPHAALHKLKDRLLLDDCNLLKRFCFILRITAKEPDPSKTLKLSDQSKTSIPQLLLPYGSGWDEMILFLLENKEVLGEGFYTHVVSVLNEWSICLTLESKATDTIKNAGLLGIHFLQYTKKYGRGDSAWTQKLVSVIFKCSVSIGEEITTLFKKEFFEKDDRRDRSDYADTLLELALTDLFVSMYLCRHLPQLVVAIAWKAWMIDRCPYVTHGVLGAASYRRNDVNACFGIHDHTAGSTFIHASGFQGPFHSLLLYHPAIGLNFILRVCNFSAESYVLSELDKPSYYDRMFLANDTFSAPEEIKVDVPLRDDSKITQYCTQRLWSGYRGNTVMPTLIQSALMALENWLIATVEATEEHEYLNDIFHHILRNSNSVMTTSVLVSVATGFPEKLGKASIPLLKVPEFYGQDLTRVSQEMGGSEINWFGALGLDSFSSLHEEDRRKAALRSWRRENLETHVARLQFTDLRDEIFQIIDDLKIKVGDDELWKFRLPRIDTRGWQAKEDKENKRIVFTSTNLDPEVMEKQDKMAKDLARTNRFCALSLWSKAEFNHEKYENSKYLDWKTALTEVKELLEILNGENVREVDQMQSGGIIRAAAVILRDHGKELSNEDSLLLIGLVLDAVIRGADGNDYSMDALDATDHSGCSAAASVLPIVLDYVAKADDVEFVKKAIATGLTHVNNHVNESTANGIREHLWSRDPGFATTCFYGAVEYARTVLSEQEKERKRELLHYEDKLPADNIKEIWVPAFRERFVADTFSPPDTSLTFKTHSGWDVLAPILIPPNGSTDQVQINFFLRMLNLCAEKEVRDDDDVRGEIDEHLSMNFIRRFAAFTLFATDEVQARLLQAVRDKCGEAPGMVHWFFSTYLHLAAKNQKLGLYWDAWSLFSDEISKITKTHNPSRYRSRREPDYDSLIRGHLFYDVGWSRVRPEEYLLTPGIDKISKFIADYGSNILVFEAFCHFLFYFPEFFMPDGLKTLATHLRNSGGTLLFSGTNTVFYLEAVLQNYLLGSGESQVPKDMHSACKDILDGLVEQASSNAYFLRDRLIRSIRKT
jgi:hypothetical protein